MYQIDQERLELLKEYFKREIDPDFLCVCLKRIANLLPDNASNILPTSDFRQKVEGNYGMVDFTLSRLIVGAFVSDTFLDSEIDKRALMKTESYKDSLTLRTVRDLQLFKLIDPYIRKWELLDKPAFALFPLNRLLLANACYFNNVVAESKIASEPLFVKYYNQLVAALILVGDGMTGEAYQLLRGLIEAYVRIYFLAESDEALDIYNRYRKYEILKNYFGQKLPDEFKESFGKRKAKARSSLDYLHFGWLDCFPDYLAKTTDKPYSITSMLKYISEKEPRYANYLATMEEAYNAGHTYVHGNLSSASAYHMQYAEIMSVLGCMTILTQKKYYEKTKCAEFKLDCVPLSNVLVDEFNKFTSRLLQIDWKEYLQKHALENGIKAE